MGNPKMKPIQCYTVAAVIEALKQLDPQTPVNQGFEGGVLVSLFNRGQSDEHVEFEEIDKSDEDGEEDEEYATCEECGAEDQHLDDGLCENCQEDDTCPTCQGTGIGKSGPPDTSCCKDCKGTGREQVMPAPEDWCDDPTDDSE